LLREEGVRFDGDRLSNPRDVYTFAGSTQASGSYPRHGENR
jgi:hypothetical protein